VSDPLIEFAEGEYDYVIGRGGRDFFLSLASYANALHSKSKIREVLSALEAETRTALERFVTEQNGLIEDAKAIRTELAERAPEIDNSAMAEPDHRSHEWTRYELDSFANFDTLANADREIGYPILPRDDIDPGPISRLLGIIRGRLSAAQYGEDGNINAPPIRNDLGDLARRIGNLSERHRASLQRYRQEARTLPGMAYARLVYFGSDLVADPVQIETDEDMAQLLDRSIREWGQPKTAVRKFANGERLEDWERPSVEETEEALKGEADRLHRELMRRLSRRSFVTVVREEPWAVAIIGGAVALVVGTLIVYYVFGVGRESTGTTGPATTTPLPTHPARVSQKPRTLGPRTPVVEAKTIEPGKSGSFVGGKIVVSVIGISFEGEPLRDRVTARVSESPGTKSLVLRNKDVGSTVRFLGRYEFRVTAISTFDATFSVTVL
jgi:hypothetical protein